ncbi:MAG: hemin uptake protein HemP [Candidatus Methylomirabilis oxyfera]|nr:hemin uptake protein HemP [Candidatus Methylomirabilis oxyfera]
MGVKKRAETGAQPEGGTGSHAVPPPPSRRRRKIEIAALFQGDQELIIVHGGEEYLLRITRNGKLILTK